jgi:hypothetical protein
MLSLPIPADADEAVPYADIPNPWGSGSMRDLMRQLGCREYEHGHLDPDLLFRNYRRAPRWRGLFGQSDSAAGHLVNQGVGPGDLFLFFGLFRKTRVDESGALRFEGPLFHAVFGYLEVGCVLDAGVGESAAFAPEFPHFRPRYRGRRCRVYVASDRLSGTGLPGFGTFCYSDALRLSAPGRVSDWQLPALFHPGAGASLTYHGAAWRWGEPAGGRVALRTVGRGQEFVAATPEAYAWARGLVSSTLRWGDAPR